MKYTVKALAKLAGVTVRTLHHYDKIGLLHPNHINDSGYRIYTNEELDQLQQIMFFRELEFGLVEIKSILNSADYNRLEALNMHRTLLIKEKGRLNELIKTIENCINEEQGGQVVEMTEKFNGLSKAELDAYREEAKEKWGKEVVENSEKRIEAKGLNHGQLQKELESIFYSIAELMDKDVSDESIQEQIIRLRAYMNQFYECTDEVFLGLAEMYVQDERFRKNISSCGAGLPEYLAKAMKYQVDGK